MQVYICERCGAEFKERPHSGLFLYRFVANNTTAGEMIDLCPNCRKGITDWLDKKAVIMRVKKKEVKHENPAPDPALAKVETVGSAGAQHDEVPEDSGAAQTQAMHVV